MSESILIQPADELLARGQYGPINHVEVELRCGDSRHTFLPDQTGAVEDTINCLKLELKDEGLDEGHRRDLNLLLEFVVAHFAGGEVGDQ